MTTSSTVSKYPVITMAGVDYQLERNGDDILVIVKKAINKDGVFVTDKVLVNGWAYLEAVVRINNRWDMGRDQDVSDEVYEIMGWSVTNNWMFVTEQQD